MNRFQGIPLKLCATLVCGTLIFKNFNEQNSKPLYAGYNYSRRYYPASSEYPDIARHRNIMARNLTLNLYSKLRDFRTPNGYTIDDAIQTGVDHKGKFTTTGIVAGDEESYTVFSELFDKIIFEKHGHKKDAEHRSDFNGEKLENATFDPEYVKTIRIRAIRNVSGYCLPPFCTRGERRDVESILVKSLYGVDDKGVYYSLKDLTPEEQATLENNNLFMERPWTPEEVSSNMTKDWPDSRGIWLSNDKKIVSYINRNDHVLVSTVQSATDLKEIFSNLAQFLQQFETKLKSNKWNFMKNKHLGYLTTDPKNLGTAMKFSVRIKLPNLAQDGRIGALLKLLNLNQNYRFIDETQHSDLYTQEEDRKSFILEISSKVTLGKSEVEIAQEFVNSINRLVEVEKTLNQGGTLDDVLYK